MRSFVTRAFHFARSRISQLEAANVRAAAQQTADSLLLQFQRQGWCGGRAA